MKKYTIKAINIYEVTCHEYWEIEADSEEEALRHYTMGICIDSDDDYKNIQELSAEVVDVEE